MVSVANSRQMPLHAEPHAQFVRYWIQQKYHTPYVGNDVGYFGGNNAGAILVDPGAPREWYVSANHGF
ncbi:hypothetical protein BI364_16025 [Acidihalobacter yilgarnensis]|uniref:Uncharacterized protein n=1 Tax=Acidihalobacter yilgarnensis TaxID=2819280 RepID=A0A1D8IRW4_9GAMM|nr:hypothetical protein [Acidihalobacter yilgarnensis]AOU99242.1 hypothetical protein BI364_16025 [Acidihalobacter yilgarnensis]